MAIGFMATDGACNGRPIRPATFSSLAAWFSLQFSIIADRQRDPGLQLLPCTECFD